MNDGIQIGLTEDSDIDEDDIACLELERCTPFLLEKTQRQGRFAVGLYVCGAKEMAKLHNQFMQDPTATDVMAFEAEQDENEGQNDPDEPIYLGDIIVCSDVAKEEAKDRNHSWQDELKFYVLHGMLHLLGLDDHSDEERAHMHALQTEALAILGKKVC